jgi:hypothetical protein
MAVVFRSARRGKMKVFGAAALTVRQLIKLKKSLNNFGIHNLPSGQTCREQMVDCAC